MNPENTKKPGSPKDDPGSGLVASGRSSFVDYRDVNVALLTGLPICGIHSHDFHFQWVLWLDAALAAVRLCPNDLFEPGARSGRKNDQPPAATASDLEDPAHQSSEQAATITPNVALLRIRVRRAFRPRNQLTYSRRISRAATRNHASKLRGTLRRAQCKCNHFQ
jgi:hypothetical protein